MQDLPGKVANPLSSVAQQLQELEYKKLMHPRLCPLHNPAVHYWFLPQPVWLGLLQGLLQRWQQAASLLKRPSLQARQREQPTDPVLLTGF